MFADIHAKLEALTQAMKQNRDKLGTRLEIHNENVGKHDPLSPSVSPWSWNMYRDAYPDSRANLFSIISFFLFGIEFQFNSFLDLAQAQV